MGALERYARQMILEEFSQAGQERLLASRVAVIGCGALGSVISNHLVRSGVGRIKIIDRDFIELNNLQRQILFDEDDISRRLPLKAVAAAAKLSRVNSQVTIEPLVTDVNPRNIEEIIGDVDLVLDGTDNFDTVPDQRCMRQTPYPLGLCGGCLHLWDDFCHYPAPHSLFPLFHGGDAGSRQHSHLRHRRGVEHSRGHRRIACRNGGAQTAHGPGGKAAQPAHLCGCMDR